MALLAGVAAAVWISLVRVSTPKCAFIPKYHWLPFFVWCISGSRALSAFLVRRRIDDCRIDNRAGGHLQSLRRQVLLHFVEQRPTQIVLLEQVTEAAHRRLVGHRLAAEIDTDKAAHRRRIVERLLRRRVRQIEPL